ncbi:class I SAM-dependent methyltransferase [Chitinophaga japonensis]|uniref:Methyltransferase family protein n=1 Tax=Chitinophaga japonensis TaxID=104662 RepID=A0A562T074_CHIJA|nr:class I SAM-dependent methyltransferase [Chitinophaga japonensis]TWI86882.1 hypothetical protein LX66_4149 [Chitinophaga japonensis]
MLNAIKKLLSSGEIDTKSAVAYDTGEMAELIKMNRAALQLVPDWIDEEAMKDSCFSYGVPDFIRGDINYDIGEELTYTDLMLYLSRKHFPELNYLEIGVSVGKNFFQLLHGRNQGQFTGYDIEEINPVLGRMLEYQGKTEWDTPRSSIKKKQSSLSSFTYKNMPVRYLSADVWDENSWARLKGERFNMVFSDALHTPEAILFEFEMLVKYNLLADRFIIVWDDLVGKMKKSFFKIIQKYDSAYKIEDIYFLHINGWIGKHEPPHSVGMIANFKL